MKFRVIRKAGFEYFILQRKWFFFWRNVMDVDCSTGNKIGPVIFTNEISAWRFANDTARMQTRKYEVRGVREYNKYGEHVK